MFKLRRWVKDTIANNASSCPLTTLNTPRSFSRRLLSEGKIIARLCASHISMLIKCQPILPGCRVCPIFIHIYNLLILEESNLAAHAKHHSSVTKSRLNEHRDTRSKCWFVNHFLWMDDLIVDEKLQSLPYIQRYVTGPKIFQEQTYVRATLT